MELIRHEMTPRKISRAIQELCRELVPNPEPRFLPVTPIAGAEVLDCFMVVDRHVREHGGSVCYGWQIWEWPGVYIEAEFHAVWRDPGGILRDLTPKQLPFQQILFLPDAARAYDGRQVKNVRRALSPRPEVSAFISACDAEHELMNRGARAYEHGQIRIDGEEARELVAIKEAKIRAYQAIVAGLPRPGRNDPCPCGSGRKFKKCCGR